MTDAAIKSPKQIAHEARNAERRVEAAGRKAARVGKHMQANEDKALLAVMRRTDRQVDHIRRQHTAKAEAAMARGETVDPYQFRDDLYSELRGLVDKLVVANADNDNAQGAQAA